MSKIYVIVNDTFDGSHIVGKIAYKKQKKAEEEAKRLEKEEYHALGYDVIPLEVK